MDSIIEVLQNLQLSLLSFTRSRRRLFSSGVQLTSGTKSFEQKRPFLETSVSIRGKMLRLADHSFG
jgi:hypothetical protein